MKLLCITGMPCAGKTTAIKILMDKFPVISMGDAIREEMKEKGINKDMREYSTDVRKIDNSYVAKLCLPALKKVERFSNVCVVDGVRNYEEVEEFRKFYDTVLIAIHASPKKRYERFMARKRKDDNLTYEGFINRDIVELKWGLGEVIALSDVIIVNEEDDIEKLRRNLEQAIKNFNNLL